MTDASEAPPRGWRVSARNEAAGTSIGEEIVEADDAIDARERFAADNGVTVAQIEDEFGMNDHDRGGG